MKELEDVLTEARRLRKAIQDQFWRLECAAKELSGSEHEPQRELIYGAEVELRRAAMFFDARCRHYGIDPTQEG